jgi:decaprenylphospho-beta-D-erythro-pentofuranosid-2-ulose 2-reductase
VSSASSPSVVIFGARSDIALPLARLYAQEGYRVILAARNAKRLEADALDLRIRSGQGADTAEFDVLDTNGHRTFLDGLGALPDVVITLVGLMTLQEQAQSDFTDADLMIRTNYLGLVSILGEIANRMEQRGSGTIIGVSSVAGDRGRASNYIYGSAKAGFTAFLSGLRNRLYGKGVTVITVKPGYVRTRMTEGLDLASALTANPDELARAIRRAHTNRKLVVYHRPVWRLIMLIIRCLPERIFVRLRL